MQSESERQKTIYELSEHNSLQQFIFIVMLSGFVFLAFQALLPVMQNFFENLLKGIVYNTDGAQLSYYSEMKQPVEKISYFFSWAVDLYVKTPGQARYWFNPFLSLFLQSVIIGLALSIIISSALPQKFGFMRQKIEREIVTLLDKIIISNYGYSDDSLYTEIVSQIKEASLRDLYAYSHSWNIPVEDLKTLRKTLIWSNSTLLYRIFHVNDGIRMYMRFYFTLKYSNAVLGFVYIGAAVLIIIIGLRGLKFIPPTQPSLVLFALGLEFSLLIFYAFTLIYSKQDEDMENHGSKVSQGNSLLLLKDLGADSKEVEKLLTIFIKSKQN